MSSLSLWVRSLHAQQPQSCLTLCNPMDCSPPGSSVHGILQTRILEWVTCPPPGDLPKPRIKHVSPSLEVDSLPPELPGKPKQGTGQIPSLLIPKSMILGSTMPYVLNLDYILESFGKSFLLASSQIRTQKNWISISGQWGSYGERGCCVLGFFF